MTTGNEQPQSPCTDVCVIDFDSGYCTGCFRSLDEIARWPVMTAEQKRDLLALLQLRRRSAVDA